MRGGLIAKFMRGVLAALLFAAFGVGSILATPVFLIPCPAAFRRHVVCTTYRLLSMALRGLGLIGISVSNEDRSVLRALKGRIVVMNHLTFLDIVVLSSLIGDSTCVVKSATLRNPFLSLVSRRVLLSNDNPARVVAEARRVLSNGINLIVFPEGTRGGGGALLPLKRGAAQLSIRCRAPVVAVRLSCDPLVLGKGMRWWDVCDRRSIYSLSVCGEITPPPCDGLVSVRAMTDEIASVLSGKRAC